MASSAARSANARAVAELHSLTPRPQTSAKVHVPCPPLTHRPVGPRHHSPRPSQRRVSAGHSSEQSLQLPAGESEAVLWSPLLRPRPQAHQQQALSKEEKDVFRRHHDIQARANQKGRFRQAGRQWRKLALRQSFSIALEENEVEELPPSSSGCSSSMAAIDGSPGTARGRRRNMMVFDGTPELPTLKLKEHKLKPRRFGEVVGSKKPPPVVAANTTYSEWGIGHWQGAKRLINQARTVVRAVEPLQITAGRVWARDGPPAPIVDSSSIFDSEHRRRVRQCQLALKGISDDPASEKPVELFSEHVTELFRARYILKAPVEPEADAYPDPIWGIRPDMLAIDHGGRPLPVSSRGTRSSGLHFSGSSRRSLQVMVPALPSPRQEQSASRVTHRLLPDSHFALGTFRYRDDDDGDDDQNWRSYLCSSISSVPGGDGGSGLSGGARFGNSENATSLDGAEGREDAFCVDNNARTSGGEVGHPAGARTDFSALFDALGPAADDGDSGAGEGSDVYDDDFLLGGLGGDRGGTGGRGDDLRSGGTGGRGADLGSGGTGGRGADLGSGGGGIDDGLQGDGWSGSLGGGGFGSDESQIGNDGVRNRRRSIGRPTGASTSVSDVEAASDVEAPVDPQVSRMLEAMGMNENGTPDFWSSIGPTNRGNGGGEGFPPPSPCQPDPLYDPDDDLQWLDGSAWRPRKKGKTACDGKDYFDTANVLRAAVERDYQHTSGGMALSGKEGVRPFGLKTLAREDLEAIRDVLLQWFPMLFRIFGYYSCIGSEVTDSIHGLTYTGFCQFLEDARLTLDSEKPYRRTARYARPRGEDGFDLLWVSVNASTLSKSQDYNSGSVLTRGEFLELLVRGAIDDSSLNDDQGQRVHELCEDILYFMSRTPHASTVLHNPDGFRRSYCYRKEVCAVLDHHHDSLMALFCVYADGGDQSSMMSAEEWCNLLTNVGFVRELTYRKLFVAFAQSRMATIAEDSKKSQVGQLHQLTFEGFNEAIVRLATVKCLPTDKEMRKAGYFDPGEFIGALLEEGVPIYNAWVERASRAQSCGLGDPIWRRVDMLVLLLVSIVQYGVEKQPGGAKLLLRGSPDERISVDEVKKYRKKPTPYVFEAGGEKLEPSAGM